MHLGRTGVDQILPVQCWCINAGDEMEIQTSRRDVGGPLCYTPHQAAPLAPQSCPLGPSPREMLIFPALFQQPGQRNLGMEEQTDINE